MTDSRNNPGSSSGFNRRDFFRGTGVAAAATALQARSDEVIQSRSATVIRGPQKIVLNVNGSNREVLAEPRTTLLEVLREQLDLTGAKPVSNDGSSGASTVLIDDKPVTASTTLALTAVGRSIRTIESFGGESPDTVVRAFVQHDAQQCGFCTPGFVIAVRAFLNKHPNATEEQIREGLNGNICRCGTYANIIQAAVAVVKGA